MPFFLGVSSPVQRYAARLLGITLSSPPISSTAACRRNPALHRLWRRLNCFWLIKAPKYRSTASKPGANRLEAPINVPNIRLYRAPDAHFVQAAVSLHIQRRSHGLCVLSDFTRV